MKEPQRCGVHCGYLIQRLEKYLGQRHVCLTQSGHRNRLCETPAECQRRWDIGARHDDYLGGRGSTFHIFALGIELD